MKSITKLLLILSVIILGLFFLALKYNPRTDQVLIEINNIRIKVDIADTLSEQIKGLGARKSITETQGMLFIYPDYSVRSFWMKGMLFPIDIIWIADNEIMGFEKNVSPNDWSKTYVSPVPVNYVLEVNADFTTRNNIKAGDKIKLIYEN